MPLDLFTACLSKKEQVYLFVKEKGYARTSDVIRFGSEIFSNRAHRDLQQLAQDGRITWLSDDEKVFRGFKGKEKVWQIAKEVKNPTLPEESRYRV